MCYQISAWVLVESAATCSATVTQAFIVGELIGKGTKELLKLRNFGQKSYQEIEDRLSSIGLSLNPKTEEKSEEAEETKPKGRGKKKKAESTAEKIVDKE